MQTSLINSHNLPVSCWCKEYKQIDVVCRWLAVLAHSLVTDTSWTLGETKYRGSLLSLPLSYTPQTFLFVFRQGLAKLPRLAFNLGSFCLGLLSSWDYGMHHQVPIELEFFKVLVAYCKIAFQKNVTSLCYHE